MKARILALRSLTDLQAVKHEDLPDASLGIRNVVPIRGISSERPSDAPELDPATAAEIDGYNREETGDDDTIVDAELVEESSSNALDLPDNVTLLRGSVGPYGPPPPPLQTHEERYGDPEPAPGRNRPRGKGKRGPRDGG